MVRVTKPSLIAAVGALVASSFASAAPLTLNLAQAFRDTKSMLASGQQADIIVMGDSLSFRPGTYLPTFRQLLQNRYGNAGAGYQGMSLWTGTGLNNGWITSGINTDISPHRSLDGLWNQYDGTSPWPNQAIVTPQGRQMQIQYVTRPGGGSFVLRRGDFGDVVTTISTNGPSGIATYNYTMPGADSQYTVAPVGDGSFTILGQNNANTSPGVRVHRAANGGWGVNNFLQRDWTFDRQLGLLNTDLVMLWIGQNDQMFTTPTYATAIDQLVTRVKTAAPSADVVLIGTYNQGSPALAGLVEGMAQVAATRGLGFINLYEAAGSTEFFLNNGYLDDGIHFSPAGGNYIGNLLYNAFVTDGRSIDPTLPRDYNPHIDPGEWPIGNEGNLPEPSSAAVILLAMGALLTRQRSLAK